MDTGDLVASCYFAPGPKVLKTAKSVVGCKRGPIGRFELLHSVYLPCYGVGRRQGLQAEAA